MKLLVGGLNFFRCVIFFDLNEVEVNVGIVVLGVLLVRWVIVGGGIVMVGNW